MKTIKLIKTTKEKCRSTMDSEGKKRLGILGKGLMLSLLALSLQSPVKAQDRVQPTWWFGAAGGANFNFYRGTVQVLNDNLTTEYAFENGFGVAPYAAIFAEYRPGRVWGIMFNVAYDGRRGQFNKTEGPTTGTPTSLNAEFDYIAFEPSLRIAPFGGNFYLFLGPRLSYNIKNHFLYQDQYSNNNEASWSDVYGVRLSAQLGIGYEIPLAMPQSRTQFNLSPFVSFLPYFGEQPRSIDNLTLTTVRAGIAIKIGCGPKPAPPVTTEVTPAPPPAPVVDFTVNAPKPIPTQRVVKEMLPLCNYVFFDEGSTAIPSRYIMLTKDQASSFAEIQLQDCQKNPGTRASRQLTMYHNVLNIVGDRMRKYPQSTIKLVGASGGRGAKIGKENAQAVKTYLVDEFGITPSRITVEGRNRPLVPSQQEKSNTIDTSYVNAEDNRVDIVSASTDLMMEIQDNSALCLKPVEVTAMDGSAENDVPVYINATDANGTLKSWTVDITDAEGSTQHFGPYTSGSQTLSASAILKDNKSGTYTVVMNGWTTTGQPVTKQTTFTLSHEVVPVQQEQRVSILFEFDKSKTVATFNKFLVRNVAPLISANSTVVISGYTDVVGTVEHNQTLSQERAQEAQSILDSATTKAGITGVTYKSTGYGEVSEPFSNTLPEERFYNRTVMIDIKPAENVVNK